jgi:hypothetical protein
MQASLYIKPEVVERAKTLRRLENIRHARKYTNLCQHQRSRYVPSSVRPVATTHNVTPGQDGRATARNTGLAKTVPSLSKRCFWYDPSLSERAFTQQGILTNTVVKYPTSTTITTTAAAAAATDSVAT